MIHEHGRVVSVRALNNNHSAHPEQEVWVETIRKSTCGSCAAKPGCGQSLLAQWADSKRTHIKLITDKVVTVDDEVVLGIEEHALLKGSLAAYGLPLVTMLLSVILASIGLGLAEGWVIVSALVGLVLGFGLVRLYGRFTREQAYRPELIEVVDHHDGWQAISVSGKPPLSTSV